MLRCKRTILLQVTVNIFNRSRFVSAYFERNLLIGKPVFATCSFVLADLIGKLCVLDFIIKETAFRCIEVYTPKNSNNLSVFRQIDLFADIFEVVSFSGWLIGIPSLISYKDWGDNRNFFLTFLRIKKKKKKKVNLSPNVIWSINFELNIGWIYEYSQLDFNAPFSQHRRS